MGKITVFAATDAAKEMVKNGWKPCNKKKGCACGPVKPGDNTEKPEGAAAKINLPKGRKELV
jgi:hypothetical protein